MFCGTAVFKPGEGLVQFFVTVPWCTCNSLELHWVGSVWGCLLHLLLGTGGHVPMTTLMIISPVITAWLSRCRQASFLASWLLFPHESKALASGIIFNKEIYHLLLKWFSIFLTFKNKSTFGLTNSPPTVSTWHTALLTGHMTFCSSEIKWRLRGFVTKATPFDICTKLRALEGTCKAAESPRKDTCGLLFQAHIQRTRSKTGWSSNEVL